MTTTLDWTTFQAALKPLLNYCRYVDEGDVENFVDQYTDDCIQDEGPISACGRDAMRERVTAVIQRYLATSHHLSNVSMAWRDDGSIAATSNVYAWHRPRTGDDLEVWGRYIDILRLERGAWRIAHRKLQVAGLRGMDRNPFAPVPRKTPPTL